MCSPKIGESLCGAFYHLSLHDLQVYLSTLWGNLVRSSGQWDLNQNVPYCPWIVTPNIVSSIINPTTVSPLVTLRQPIVSENTQPAYSNDVHPLILSNIRKLIPTMPEDYHRRLLRALRHGFILRLMLDNRDRSSGPCHNMIWTINHFVSVVFLILIALSFNIAFLIEPLSQPINSQL